MCEEEQEDGFPSKLNRYTTLPYLLELLCTKRLTLTDPKHWEDKNDVKALDKYRGDDAIRCLCFAASSETIHHWKAFANDITGCCIEFDGEKFRKQLKLEENSKLNDLFCKPEYYNIKENSSQNLIFGKVRYCEIGKLKQKQIQDKQLPFIKRYPYRLENEWRIVWKGHRAIPPEIIITLNCIRKITFTQYMSDCMFICLKETIKKLIGEIDITINRSTIFENEEWLEALGVYLPQCNNTKQSNKNI
jgi:hypothetical protein